LGAIRFSFDLGCDLWHAPCSAREGFALKTNSEIIGTTIKRLAIGYELLLTLAAGGLAFANIFGFVATVFHFG
jgi:hypothetical protein